MFSKDKLKAGNLSVEFSEPIAIFEASDFLDPADYRQLDADFPDKSLFRGRHEGQGDKLYLNNKMPEFQQVLSASPTWRAFLSRFSDADVVAGLFELASRGPSDRPFYQQRAWKLVGDKDGAFDESRGSWLDRIRAILTPYTPAQLKVEFSYLEAGCFIPPHTDSTKKLISLIMYFPDPGVDYGDSAGTEFYRGKGSSGTRSSWKSKLLVRQAADAFFADHETFYKSSFSPNKLVGFVKSSVSWHGLRGLAIPAGATRRSVNINYYTA